MVSVHTTVTVQAFNGTRDGRRMIFCAHIHEGERLVKRHVRLFEKTYSPGEDIYAS